MTSIIRIIFVLQLIPLTGATESGIVDGQEAKPHSRPYMASLQAGTWHVCGGILIRDDFVLTAAHCTNDCSSLTVVLGAHNITKSEESQQRIEVAKYYPHPKFHEYDCDIMLLKLKNKAKLNKNVNTLALPKKDKKIPFNLVCDVAGWGRTGPREAASSVLRETTEKLQMNDECKRRWNTHKAYFNPNHMLCTMSGKKRGVCQGDSGGPLICKSKLRGITAFTEYPDCSNTARPHVFTKISAFLPWIRKVMAGLENA